jgi:hypothetical protein
LKRRWKAVIGVIVLVLIVAYYLAFLIPLPARKSPSIPWVVQITPYGVPNGEGIPIGNFPINKTEATDFATNLTKDYNNLVDSNQALYLSAQNLRRFFPLYQSFQVYIARENWTQGPERMEFFFVNSPSATRPQITVFTNESAKYLRPVEVVGIGELSNNSYSDYWSSFGYYMGDLTTQSPIGVNHFDAIWITNSSSVYNDTLFNANKAARAIYDANVGDYNYTTNPQFLSPRWFSFYAFSTIGNFFEVLSFLATAITIYEGRKHFGWFRFRKPNLRIRHPRQSKTPPKKAKDEGTEGEDEEPKE